MPNALPVAADLQAFLESANSFDATWNLDLQSALDAAVEELEEKTKHRPFLAGNIAEARQFTMNAARVLQLDCGLAQLDSVTLGFYGTLGYQVSPFNALFYIAKPMNAAQTKKPITRIEFASPVSGIVQITGLWGYGTTVPQLAFEAVMAGAAKRLAPRIAAAKAAESGKEAGLLKARQIGTIREEFTSGNEAAKALSVAHQIAQWDAMSSHAFGFFRLKRI